MAQERLDFNVLNGRCQKIFPHVTIDVGHNAMAAEALAKTFLGKRVFLVYNSYKDKDFTAILKILQPIIHTLLVIEIQSPRAASQNDIYAAALGLGIKTEPLASV